MGFRAASLALWCQVAWAFAAAQFAPVALPKPLPMHLYKVQESVGGDSVCPKTLNLTKLTLGRQLTIQKYSNLKEAASFEDYDKGMRTLWDAEDKNIKVIVPAAGTYTGIEKVIEYISLVVGVANDGYAYFYNSSISNFQYFPNNASYSFQVAQKSKYFCTSPPSATSEGACQTDEIDSLSLHHVSFRPCSTLIKQYVIAYDDTQNYLAAKGASAVSVCSRHNQYCLGNNRQFDDFQHCMRYMEGIPSVTCGAEVFNGNNMLCRFKHSFMMKFRPDVHCPHVGPGSDECIDEDCENDFASCTAPPGDLNYSPVLNSRCCASKQKESLSKCPKTDCE